MTRSKMQIALWLVIVVAALATVGWWVYKVDPFMHYHAPDTDTYYYRLNTERSQNDGIIKHFNYDALITGTSMAENFKTTELDALFGVTSVKAAYAGGSFKEVNDNIQTVLKYNSSLKLIVRSIEPAYFLNDKDWMASDSDEFPTYLYDSNPFNDVQYLFNRDVIWNRVWLMLSENEEEGFTPGITSFDDYIGWFATSSRIYGIGAVLPYGMNDFEAGEAVHLTGEERETIRSSIEQNFTSLANAYPDVDFYYFISPYSAVCWQQRVEDGTVYKYLEAEQYIIELILEETDNIHLFSFNTRTDIITDLNNYKDPEHYGKWVNSLMLQWMHDGKYELTEDNYLDYLAEEQNFYLSFDYLSLNDQEDYEADLYAGALLNKERTGAEPLPLLDVPGLTLKDAVIVSDQYDGTDGILCTGALSRVSGDEYSIEQSLYDGNYIGASVTIDDISDYGYLTFYGQKLADHGQPTVMVFDTETGEKLAELSAGYWDIDNEWHQYVLDVTDLTGAVTIVLNGGYIDNTGNTDSSYVFSDIVLY